ncbi:MAG: UDP-glucose 4-epimerase GalE [Sneathiellaceae bacterium]
MRTLLTGGAGYVGSACFRALRAQGGEAFVYDDLSTGNAAAVARDRLTVGSLADGAALADTLARLRIDTVMHFAALSIMPDSLREPERYWQVNLDGTRTLLQAMAKAGVRRLVFSSTAAVYALQGPEDASALAEGSRLDPATPYGASKLACEWLIRDFLRVTGGGAVILRYFNAAGATPDGSHGESRAKETHLIPIVMANALGRRPAIEVYGTDWPTPDGTCLRDYVHVDDIAQAHLLAGDAVAPGAVEIFNIGSGRGYSVREVIDSCARVTGNRVDWRAAPRRSGDPAVLVSENAKLRQRLGWAPAFPELDDIVRSAWLWHRDHPQGYGPGGAGAPA